MRCRREVLGCVLSGALIVVSLSASAQPDERPPGEAEPQPPPAETEPPPPPEPPPAPQPQPQPQPPAQPPPAYPYGYPPPGYPPPGYPPPGYPYPPPGYGYPPGYPPPGYPPPGQYGQAPTAPVKKKPRYPDDSAAQTSPFIDLLVAGVNQEHRFTHFLTFGISAGVFLGGIVRIAPQVSMFVSEPDDKLAEEEDVFSDSDTLPDGYRAEAADSPAILWGGAVGIAAVSRESFVLSPGVLALRTDVDAFGTFVGLHAPFEWVSSDGARVGFAVAFGRAFGGSVRATCSNSGFTPPNCDPGEVRDFDRESGAAFYANFQLGWGLNHPDPLPENAR